ncbi:MAG TPA: ABC transporter substrate-binding protein [Patescibacteria group bacterium]|nr:ABC transporter substrate-binding protein [Patescibacteria group bacterium]
MTKKFKRILIAVSVILVVAIAATMFMVRYYSKPKIDEKTASLPKVIVGFPIQSLDATPIILAYQKGFFREQGIDVSLVHLQSSEGALAVGTGQVDITITGARRLFGPIEKGAPVKLLSIMSDMPSHLFVRPDSDIVTIKDLEGKKISVGPAGSQKLRIIYVLELEGVDINKIEFIDIEKLYLPMALMDKKAIDAALIDEPAYVDKAKEQGAVVLPYWYEKDLQKVPTGSSVSINTDFLKNNVENVNKFYRAMIQAHRYLRDNLNDSSIIITDYIRENTSGAMDIKPEEFVRQVNDEAVRYILWQDPSSIVEMARINYDLGFSERVLSLDDLYDLRFKELLESAQNEIYSSATN